MKSFTSIFELPKTKEFKRFQKYLHSTIFRSYEIEDLLRRTVLEGNYKKAELLVSKYRVNPCASDIQTSLTAFEIAMSKNDIKMTRMFLKYHFGEPRPLHYFTAAGNNEMVKFLLIHTSINPFEVNWRGLNCLHLAAQCNRVETFKLLLSLTPLNPSQPTLWGDTPLSLAVRSRSIRIIRELLKFENLDTSTRRKDTNETALHFASKSGCPEIVKLLLEKTNLNPNDKTHRGATCLTSALYSFQPKVAIPLIECERTDVSLAGDRKETPLHIAAGNGSLDMVRLIIERVRKDQLMNQLT